MTTDLWMLVLASLLAVVHTVAYSLAVLRQTGIAYNAGPRDENRQPTGVAGRLRRAHVNFLETYPVFAAAVLTGYVAGASDAVTAAAAGTYVVARGLYLPCYAFGIPYLRTLVWCVATGAILVIFWRVAT